ncbi:uncharacterized protein EV420DRAFT_1481402 [Desarmillaria tabescens]|uniref:Uncharacterized protein n=1 Tax=Armillaria tabescens TaxID=1929756 RepID=A0AA39N2I4_ARMTA|nr:uncharacterized protein EV420DRAFT_1481402 [Desarmillaria tabescens]KAK0455567.1 hypothetical protein EV420DRAFT_1481402 [Desarmillaria tabescens]
MYFAILAFLMLVVAYAAPLDSTSLPAPSTNNSPNSHVASNPASKHTVAPTLYTDSSPPGTKKARSIPMVMQARALETLSHSRIEKIRRSMIDRDEGRVEQKASPSARAHRREEPGEELLEKTVEKIKSGWNSTTSGQENKGTPGSQIHPGASSTGDSAVQKGATTLQHRTRDHSSDNSVYPPVSSISSRQLRAPDYSSAGSQSNSTTEENGSQSTNDQETKEKRTLDPNGTVTKRTAPVEWSKNWSNDQAPTGTERERAPSNDNADPTFKTAQRDARSLLAARSGDDIKAQGVSA